MVLLGSQESSLSFGMGIGEVLNGLESKGLIILWNFGLIGNRAL